MVIYLTGDIHSNIERFKTLNAKKDDIVIILGDFGILWLNENHPNREEFEISKLEKLCSYPWTTLFLDGNHENFDRLNSLPVTTMFGNEVGVVRENKIFHLKRGKIYTIENKKFFTFGGATSIDKSGRVEGVSWWHDEVSSSHEEDSAMCALKNLQYNVDYVLTHTPPDFVINILTCRSTLGNIQCPVARFLNRVADRTNFKNWYAGHMHEDGIIMQDRRFVMLYTEIIKLGETVSESNFSLPYIY